MLRALPAVVLLVACSSSPPNELSLVDGATRAHVTLKPFALRLERDGATVLTTHGGPRATRDTPEFVSQLLPGWAGIARRRRRGPRAPRPPWWSRRRRR